MNKQIQSFRKYGRPILIGGGIGAICALLFFAGMFHSWSDRLSDRLYTAREPDSRIVIVAIDDASLKKIGRWPWDRNVHAELIRKITDAGASVIAYDVNFSEIQNGEADADLAAAIRTSGRVILPTELSLTEVDNRLIADSKKVIEPLTVFGGAALRMGFSNTPPDSDGIVRSIPLRVYLGGEHTEVYPFAFEAAQAFDRMLSVALAPVDRLGRIIVAYPGAPKATYRTYSAADVLQGGIEAGAFKDKLVFVGSTASDLHDEQLVPTSFNIPMPGVEIHASFADTMLQRRWLQAVSPWIFALSLVGIGLLVGWILSRSRIWFSICIIALLFAGTLIFSVIVFNYGLIVNVLWLMLTILASFVGVVIERRVLAEQDRRVLRQTFEHYVSPSVVDLIVRDPTKLKLGGQRRNMTVLFSDIRVFTVLTETTEPEALIQKLNAFFGAMTEEIFKQKGVLDKYMGDAVMAFWNAPFEQTDHALRCVEAALSMQKSLELLNRSGVFGNPPWRMGIGINTGEMIVGNIGGENHSDYTVIGDSVNLASRLEGLTREYNVSIIISEQTAKALDGRMLLRKLDRVVVKGRYQVVTVYEVICEMTEATSAQKELVELYEKTLALYCERNFDEVIFHCRQILMKYPGDEPTLLLNTRARAFLDNPPPMGWDGTWVYTAK